MPRIFASVDEFAAATGTELGTSEWIELSQERIDAFAEATLDRQWIHTDPARAADGPFGSTIAHGYLTLSLIPHLLDQIFRVEHLAALVNYGAERLRFPSPVPVGSRVRAHMSLTEAVPISLGTRATIAVTVEREGHDKPALVAELVFVLSPA